MSQTFGRQLINARGERVGSDTIQCSRGQLGSTKDYGRKGAGLQIRRTELVLARHHDTVGGAGRYPLLRSCGQCRSGEISGDHKVTRKATHGLLISTARSTIVSLVVVRYAADLRRTGPRTSTSG